MKEGMEIESKRRERSRGSTRDDEGGNYGRRGGRWKVEIMFKYNESH